MENTHCILTGYQFDESVKFEPILGTYLEYTFWPAGRVKIALATLTELKQKEQFHNPVLAGICRNAFENGQEPPLINTEFISVGLKNIKYPKTTKEKAKHLLKYLYDKGGKDLVKFKLSSSGDHTIAYAVDSAEFITIMEFLQNQSFIDWKNVQNYARGVRVYHDVSVTEYGVEEVEKELPKVPLISLVVQEISTGDSEVDEKINHAKDLFFIEPQTMDRMRSSCESLIYILEPLRQDVKKYFKAKDTEDFFNIVNNFDIRHNKESTKDIEHPEQLEWIFYSLLNTINTFTKLKQRLEN